MPILDTWRFQDAEKYAAYLETPAGRLRSELAWGNLLGFLPLAGSKRHALVFDYLGLEGLTDEAYREVSELELTLGAKQEFAAMARYLQVVARRSRASSSKETGR